MSLPVRLIASDLDGTLLTPNRVLGEANLAAIRRALDAGIIFCLASGRSISTMRRFADQIGIIGPIVSCNGAYVTGLDGELIEHHRLSRTAVDGLIGYAREHQLHTHTYCGTDVFFSNEGELADLYRARTQLDNAKIASLSEMSEMQPDKILFIDHPVANERHQANLEAVAAKTGITIVRSEPDYIEFLPQGITKGAGLAILCRHLDILPEQVAAIGDWLNDKEMLQWAGHSAAVANAHPDILALVDQIVPSNLENGVAAYLDFILGSAKPDILLG